MPQVIGFILGVFILVWLIAAVVWIVQWITAAILFFGKRFYYHFLFIFPLRL